MKRNNVNNHLRCLTIAALFAAMVYVMTAFVHIPTHKGYVHIGDGMIYIAAAFLPTPYAMGAAAIGAGMSDYLSGYAIWVLPTMIIKASMASVFTSKRSTIVNKRNLFSVGIAGVIGIVGYYLANAVLAILSGADMGAAFISALADIPTNIIQAVASGALFVLLGAALDRTSFRKRVVQQ